MTLGMLSYSRSKYVSILRPRLPQHRRLRLHHHTPHLPQRLRLLPPPQPPLQHPPLHPNSHTDTYSHADANAHTDRYTNSRSYAHANSNPESDSNSNSNSNAIAYSDSNSNARHSFGCLRYISGIEYRRYCDRRR